MKFTRIAVLFFALSSVLLAVPNVDAELILSVDGLTVYDGVLKVRWLANANLPGAAEGRFGVANIAPNGSMDYATALQWVDTLNGLNGGVGYLGHNNWTLPTTPTFPATDPSCSAINRQGGGSFGFGCMNSDLGSLYYVSLGLQYPNTVVPIPDDPAGPFHNFQPYLYWSDTGAGSNGYHSFSFNTGWAGESGSGSKTIKPGRTLTIRVAFKPTSRGSKSAILEIDSNDLSTPILDISLTGTGQ